jgi:hypothetical protein
MAYTILKSSALKMEQIESPETSANTNQTPGKHPKDSTLNTKHGESLKSRILHLYGEETARHMRLLEKLRTKKTKLLSSLTFLLRCRDHNTIPHFLQFQHHIHSRAANRIYNHTSLALLRERIHQNRRELDNISRDLLELHLQTANAVSESDWTLLHNLSYKKATRVGEESKATQIKKFTHLCKTQHPTTHTPSDTVINLSEQVLDEGLSSLLQKGLNYAVTPRSIPMEDILTGVEKAIKSLPVEKAEEARQETVRIIKKLLTTQG